MRTVIVPNDLRDRIHAAITKALAGRPCTDEEREIHYRSLLAYFDEYGTIPDFDLTPGDARSQADAHETGGTDAGGRAG